MEDQRIRPDCCRKMESAIDKGRDRSQRAFRVLIPCVCDSLELFFFSFVVLGLELRAFTWSHPTSPFL
jgi:hypothetical protein